ncbi:Ger(x)C family spore germination protein [Paenibacillus xylanilyticus]|uniref:Ger(x)C family spore germination protein n=1 Tax=Paenibacillus xylanilyticus TaxID=248903 RepID=UPI0039A3BC38
MRWFGKFIILSVSCILLAALAGCANDKTNLEDATVPLALGLDVKDKKLHYFISAPVFSKDIQKKTREGEGIAEGLRQSRNQQDAQFPGSLAGRNFQVIIVGKQLLQYKDWFNILDVTFRDPRNTITDRIVAFDGPIEDVFQLQPKDQPPLPLFIRAIVDSGSRSSATVKTTAQELHRQLYDRAMTPSISEIKIENNKILLKGTTLLSRKGQYRTSLTYQETTLLHILKNEAEPGVSLTFAVDDLQQSMPFNIDKVSFSLGDISVKIKSSHENGRFQFKIKVKSIISITEKFLEFELLQNSEEMATKLSEEMKKNIEKLIKKCQDYNIDPVGFGLFARAYQYPLYKEVQDNWGEELSRAHFDVDVDLRIAATGAVE